MRLGARIPLLTPLWLCVVTCTLCAAHAQESGPPAAPAADSSLGFEQTVPPKVDLGKPLEKPVVPAPATPELEKIEQVRAEMDRSQRVPETPAAQPPPDFSLYRSAARVFSALLLVLATILLLTYVLKRHGKRSALLSGPTLATILGRVYLEPRVRLHFVRTGGKVIVVGVTQNSIASLAEFDAESFALIREGAHEKGPVDVAGFMEQLKTSMHNIQERPTEPSVEDAEVSALKRDIERLQKYIDEAPRPPKAE